MIAETDLENVFADLVASLGEQSAAIGLTKSGTIATFGNVDSIVPVASITKALVSYAFMVATEEEVIALDQPCGPLGATVRHVLAHAAGYGFLATDRCVPPGTRRAYSNHGFDVLGQLLEHSSGIAVSDYLRQAVFEPLQMTKTSLVGSPAKDAYSTALDLSKFATELISPTLIHRTTFTEFCRVQLGDLHGIVPGVGMFRPNPWGLGVEIRGGKFPHWTGTANTPETFGHFGGQGSFLWVDPTVNVALVAVNNRQFGKWALETWPKLSDHVLERAAGIANIATKA
jgi:CubicO group peptidase (beta-lactamase class C family)